MTGFDYGYLVVAALLAGSVDAVVGGGGLILTPSLFTVLPHTHPATLFGINKVASICGTFTAACRYARRVSLDGTLLAVALPTTLLGACAGAWLVTQVSSDYVRKILPFILLAIFIYTFTRKQLGMVHQPQGSPAAIRLFALVIGLSIGFYDGFLGPGTGSFLIFALVRFRHFDFLHASAHAKVINITSNLGALLIFSVSGHIQWPLALLLAFCNVIGSFIGTHIALKYGSALIRQVFMVVVSVLIIKVAVDAFL